MKNFNDMKKRIKLYKYVEEIDDEANHNKEQHFVDEVWANVNYKPKYITRENATEQVLICYVTIRKHDLNFQAVEIDGRLLELKIPPYSDSVYTYFQGEVNFYG